MTWDDFYEQFYDLSLSTQKSYAYKLTNYGDAEEVFEVLSEFAFYDKYFATRFASRSVDGGVHFSPDHVLEMTLLIDKPVLSQMAETAEPAFDREQLEEIYMLIDDASFTRISKKQNIDIFSDEELDEEFLDPESGNKGDFVVPPQKKIGFFGMLFAVAAGVSLADASKGKRHNGRCDGDCANCPPHYGYRYGRWYYGHDHQYGCEFGGNHGSGQMD